MWKIILSAKFVFSGLGCGSRYLLNSMVHILTEVQEAPASGDHAGPPSSWDHSGSLL